MKNRNKLRTMNIDVARYLWSYNFDDMDFINYPYSYSDNGTPCLYKGEKI